IESFVSFRARPSHWAFHDAIKCQALCLCMNPCIQVGRAVLGAPNASAQVMIPARGRLCDETMKAEI
ncbi:MAG: hypothetical protein QHJ82_13120, partial [Verrucomicrobiota bacterium]|nr:hypothetical protein [Verrucomicrobiota bacterium]